MIDEYLAYVSKVSDLRADMLKSLEFIKWKDQIKTDSTVFIKPNFTFPTYREGITTSPDFLKNLIEIIKDRADNVIIGESDGGNHTFSADDSFEGHGLFDICRNAGAELVNLSKIPRKSIEEEILGKKVRIQLPKLLLDGIDCFASVPVLKVHTMTSVTLGIKNLWGCYPDTMRCLHHQDFDRKITLIAKLLNPKIIVIDGLYALDGHGHMYGNAKRTDLILSSNNPVTADSLGSTIMGMPLAKAKHILIAEKAGLGTTNLDAATINDDWQKLKLNFSLNKTLIDYISLLTFNSDILAKFVVDSPFTPLVYKVAKYLRTPEETGIANDMKR